MLAADGQGMAIKVQRLGILDKIALDLYILQLLTPAETILQNKINGTKTNQTNIDTALALVDKWGHCFVAKMDNQQEANNTRKFGEFMHHKCFLFSLMSSPR